MSNTYTIRALDATGKDITYKGCKFPRSKSDIMRYAYPDGRVIAIKDSDGSASTMWIKDEEGGWFKAF